MSRSLGMKLAGDIHLSRLHVALSISKWTVLLPGPTSPHASAYPPSQNLHEPSTHLISAGVEH